MNALFCCLSQKGEMASKRMATSSSPPKLKKAEAAKAADAVAAGTPPASVFAVWSRCCCCCLIISLTVAAELFFNCCVPPAMAGESLPSSFQELTSTWGRDDLRPHAELTAVKLRKKEWAQVDSVYPEASSELQVVSLPIPRIEEDGTLAFLKKAYTDNEDLVMLDAYFGSGPMRDVNELATDNLQIMSQFMKLLRKHFCEKDLNTIPTANSLAQEAKTVAGGDKLWNCSIAKVARADDDNSKMAAVINQDSDENIDVRLSLSKPTPIPGASEHGPKVLSWEYSARFKMISNKLTPINDSLTVIEEGDSDEDGITGKWTINHKIERSDDDNTDWQEPTGQYSWNMKCSDGFNPSLPGYEYTWNSDYCGILILNESFVGKTPIHHHDKTTTASESSIAKPKCRQLLLTREHDKKVLSFFYTGDERNLVDKVVEYTDGGKVHSYFIRKTHYDNDCILTWTGSAVSKPGQYLSITLDNIPLNFHHHSGMYKISIRLPEFGLREAAEQGFDNWIIHPLTCARYATKEISPSRWCAALKNIDEDMEEVRVDFYYTSEDLALLAQASKGLIAFPEKAPVKLLKQFLSSPVENGRVTLPKKAKVLASQILANPKDNLDEKSSITDSKFIALNGAFLFFIALSLFVFVKSLNRSPKSQKLLMRH